MSDVKSMSFNKLSWIKQHGTLYLFGDRVVLTKGVTYSKSFNVDDVLDLFEHLKDDGLREMLQEAIA